MNHLGFAEYLWIDGSKPTQQLRSKTRVIQLADKPQLSDFPLWHFAAAATQQADGQHTDCILSPVRFYPDPLRGAGHYLVFCEVFDASGDVHISNQRANLRAVVDRANATLNPWFGFAQQYTLFRFGRPLGFPAMGLPPPQGPYYCSVGCDNAFGREIAEQHANACLQAGIVFYGMNAEAMPGQWEFQLGYRHIDTENCDALSVADDLWVARYLLQRVAETHDVVVSYANKPQTGDWQGAALHCQFSTSFTRNKHYGLDAIQIIIDSLKMHHGEHIRHYGDGLTERLTGEQDTSHIRTFKCGVAHRGASVRIPLAVAEKGYGYLQDRRPGANADPYRVAICLISAVIGQSVHQGRKNIVV